MSNISVEPFGPLRYLVFSRRLRHFSLWLIIGFVVAWAAIASFSGAGAQIPPDLDRFDPDVYPAIDVGHTPPVLVRSDETVRLEFVFACSYVQTPGGRCWPNATLFVARGPLGAFAPVPLAEENHDSLQVLAAEIPAMDADGQSFRYYLEVRDDQVGVSVRYPISGVIEPTVVPVFTPIDVPAGEMASTEPVIRLPWGDGAGEVGLSAGPEQATIGPDALDVAPDGTIALLDHVNARVTLINPTGHMFRSYTAPVKGVGDIAIDAEGRVTVLDLVGERTAQSKARVPQLYRLGSNGALEVTASVFARYPSKLTENFTVMDMADVRSVVPLDLNGQPQAREAQRQSRSRPDLQVQWLTDYRSRLADTRHGLAFELQSNHPLGAVAHFARTPQGYVAVFEWHNFNVVWFNADGHILKNTIVPNKQYSVFNPSGRVAVDQAGDVYILGSTPVGIEIYRVQRPQEVTP